MGETSTSPERFGYYSVFRPELHHHPLFVFWEAPLKVHYRPIPTRDINAQRNL